jgi:hypothetical protein
MYVIFSYSKVSHEVLELFKFYLPIIIEIEHFKSISQRLPLTVFFKVIFAQIVNKIIFLKVASAFSIQKLC